MLESGKGNSKTARQKKGNECENALNVELARPSDQAVWGVGLDHMDAETVRSNSV
jgi:hypothetical protein